MSALVVPRRFCGPPLSGNGGYTAGVLAQAVHATRPGSAGTLTVQLRTPPPLEVDLEVVDAGEQVELRDGPTLVAVARTADPGWDDEPAPQPVTLEVADRVWHDYPGLAAHPFPGCFSCGPARSPGDGLRIFPGRVDPDRVAAPWTPDPDLADDVGAVSVPVVWAALDCVGGWSSDLEHRPLVLAQMTARLDAPVRAGAAHVLVGAHRRTEGRKTWTASVLLDADGTALARAEHLWIAVDWAVVHHLQRS